MYAIIVLYIKNMDYVAIYCVFSLYIINKMYSVSLVVCLTKYKKSFFLECLLLLNCYNK